MVYFWNKVVVTSYIIYSCLPCSSRTNSWRSACVNRAREVLGLVGQGDSAL